MSGLGKSFSWADYDKGSGYVDAGTYLLYAESFIRPDRGRDQLDITFAICANVTNKKLVSSLCWETATLEEKTIWRFVNLLKAVDAPPTFDLTDDDEIWKVIGNKIFKADIIVDEWQGKKRNKIGEYLEMTAGDKKLVKKLGIEPGTSSEDKYVPEDGDPGTAANGEFSEEDVPF